MNKIIYSSRWAEDFAKYLAALTGGQYRKTKKMYSKSGPDSYVFFVGMYCPEDSFWKKISFKKAIILFAGKDITQLLEMKKTDRKDLFKILSSKGAIFATEAKVIKDNIYNLFNLKTEIIYLPSKFDFSKHIHPMPSSFNVGCYMPENHPDYYNCKTIMDVTERMKDITFHFYSLSGSKKPIEWKNKVSNIIFYSDPIVNIPSFLNKMSCGLRITEFDTYSMSGIEYNLAGRYFINNHYMPCCEILSKKPSVQEIIEKINIVRKNIEPNIEGKKYYSKRHSVNIFKKSIAKIFRIIKRNHI